MQSFGRRDVDNVMVIGQGRDESVHLASFCRFALECQC